MLGEIAAVATALGIGVAILQLRQAQRQRVLDFEARFMERYWQLIEGLPPECVIEGECVGSTDAGRRSFAAYLRLCEDECDYRKNLWVTDDTWALWREGMQEHLGDGGLFHNHWRALEKDGRAPNGQGGCRFPQVRRVMNDCGADPLRGAQLRRWARAL